MDTADLREGEAGGGLSTEKQNITSAALVCVCAHVCIRIWVRHTDEKGLLQKLKNPKSFSQCAPT